MIATNDLVNQRFNEQIDCSISEKEISSSSTILANACIDYQAYRGWPAISWNVFTGTFHRFEHADIQLQSRFNVSRSSNGLLRSNSIVLIIRTFIVSSSIQITDNFLRVNGQDHAWTWTVKLEQEKMATKIIWKTCEPKFEPVAAW